MVITCDVTVRTVIFYLMAHPDPLNVSIFFSRQNNCDFTYEGALLLRYFVNVIGSLLRTHKRADRY